MTWEVTRFESRSGLYFPVEGIYTENNPIAKNFGLNRFPS